MKYYPTNATQCNKSCSERQQLEILALELGRLRADASQSDLWTHLPLLPPTNSVFFIFSLLFAAVWSSFLRGSCIPLQLGFVKGCLVASAIIFANAPTTGSVLRLVGMSPCWSPEAEM